MWIPSGKQLTCSWPSLPKYFNRNSNIRVKSTTRWWQRYYLPFSRMKKIIPTLDRDAAGLVLWWVILGTWKSHTTVLSSTAMILSLGESSCLKTVLRYNKDDNFKIDTKSYHNYKDSEDQYCFGRPFVARELRINITLWSVGVDTCTVIIVIISWLLVLSHLDYCFHIDINSFPVICN